MTSETSPAQLAYDACRQHLVSNAPDDWAGFEGGYEWESLPPVYRDAWAAAAQAVRDDVLKEIQ